MIKTIIAVDPDVTRSGVAVVDVGNRSIEVHAMTFPELLKFFCVTRDKETTRVAIEAGWLNKPNWHKAPSIAAAANVGMRIGRNHETGRKIVEMCEDMGYSISLVKPLVKRGTGASGKTTHEELQKVLKRRKMTFGKKRTNQDERDSILIAIYEYDRL